MINFETGGFGLGLVANLIDASKERVKNLPNTLYVFGASEERPALIYLSPDLPHAEKAADFIEKFILEDGECWVEQIGDPPYNNWVAFNKVLRRKNPKVCAGVAMFLEKVIHNLITWE